LPSFSFLIRKSINIVVAHFFYMIGSGTPAIKAGGEQPRN
jgi:hypothetical protein